MIVTNCSIKGLKDAQWAEERQDRVPRHPEPQMPRSQVLLTPICGSELGVSSLGNTPDNGCAFKQVHDKLSPEQQVSPHCLCVCVLAGGNLLDFSTFHLFAQFI